MKQTNYFPHDAGARNDEKLIRLRMRHGAAGYGVYFMVLERLREETGYVSVKDYNMIAFDLRVDAALIKSVVEDFGLFAFTDDGKCFYSVSFIQRMTTRYETTRTSRQRREAALKRWGKSQKISDEADGDDMQNDANAMQMHMQNDANVMQMHMQNDANVMQMHMQNDANVMQMHMQNDANAMQMHMQNDAYNIKQTKQTKEKKGCKEKPAAPAAAPTPPGVSSSEEAAPDDLAARQREFWTECKALAARYGAPLVEAFFGYWSEPTPDGRMRFELERTWDVARRMAAWNRNEAKWAAQRGGPRTAAVPAWDEASLRAAAQRAERSKQQSQEWDRRQSRRAAPETAVATVDKILRRLGGTHPDGEATRADGEATRADGEATRPDGEATR